MSQSRLIADAVGVAVELGYAAIPELSAPLGICMVSPVLVGGPGGTAIPEDLKDPSMFCADDFRRIPGLACPNEFGGSVGAMIFVQVLKRRRRALG